MKKIFILTIFTIMFLLVSGINLWAIDYQHTLKAKDITFSWTIENDQIYIEISGKTKGWVGIGFNPGDAMKDANIIIGAVKNGKVKIQDHYGNRERGHIADSNEGGTDNVRDVMGSEKDGITIISFNIPLNSGDKFDANIKADGTDIVMLAYGGGRDNFTGRHPFRTVYEVNLKTGKNKKVK